MNDRLKMDEENVELGTNVIEMSHYQTLCDEKAVDEISELKKRITELEHMVVSQSITKSPFSNDDYSSLTHEKLVQRITSLESLLAASEFDHERKNAEIQDLKASVNDRELKIRFITKEKDDCIKNLEHDVELFNVKLTKSIKKIVSLEDYIHSLPSQQELDDINIQLTKTQNENDILADKLVRVEVILRETEEALAEKDNLCSSLLQRLEYLKPIEAAQEALIAGTDKDSTECKLDEINIKQKTQLNRCIKIINSQRKKICDLDTERAILLKQISEKEQLVESLLEKQRLCQLDIECAEKRFKKSEERNRLQEQQIFYLKAKTEETEKIIKLRRNEMKYVIRIITEINTSIDEMSSLLEFCEHIRSEDEIPMELFLGFDTKKDLDEFSVQTDEDTLSKEEASDFDEELLLTNLKRIRGFRSKIKNIRSEVSEIYTDMLSNCNTPSNCSVQ